jgi:hypothetical protein
MAADINDLIDQWEPALQRAFLDSIYKIRDQAQIDQIVRMLERGDVDGAVRAVGLDPTQFRPFDKAITAAFEAGGEATAAIVPALIDGRGFRLSFQFSIRNPAAEDWLKSYSSGLVTEMINDQRDAIRGYLADGLAQGANPKSTALDLVGRVSRTSGRREGGIIGLTSSQEQWVRNYRDELLSDDPTAALERALRDKRFDKRVRRAAARGEKLSAGDVEPMVTAYKNRALRYRAETIGRKETITSLHTAQDQAMQQAAAVGNIDQRDVSYIWHTAHDDRVRETHRPMDRQVRQMGTPFTTGAGVHLMYPGDPSGPAAEVINCRCWREPKINFLRGIK